MGTTPIYALPWPAASEPPNGPLQLQGLAQATEDAITGNVRFHSLPLLAVSNQTAAVLGTYSVPNPFAGKPCLVIITYQTVWVPSAANLTIGLLGVISSNGVEVIRNEPQMISTSTAAVSMVGVTTGVVPAGATIGCQVNLMVRAGSGTVSASGATANRLDVILQPVQVI